MTIDLPRKGRSASRIESKHKSPRIILLTAVDAPHSVVDSSLIRLLGSLIVQSAVHWTNLLSWGIYTVLRFSSPGSSFSKF